MKSLEWMKGNILQSSFNKTRKERKNCQTRCSRSRTLCRNGRSCYGYITQECVVKNQKFSQQNNNNAFTLSLSTFGPAFPMATTGSIHVLVSFGVCFTQLLVFFGGLFLLSMFCLSTVVIIRVICGSLIWAIIRFSIFIVITFEFSGIFLMFCFRNAVVNGLMRQSFRGFTFWGIWTA